MSATVAPNYATEMRWVTSNQAAHWLATINIGNRAISSAEERRWVDRFNTGRYMPTHQGIAFDESGHLLDGQTRLSALVKSNLGGIWIMVTTDVPRAAFSVMDAGRNRQAAQLIPGPHATAKGAAARLMLDYPRFAFPSGKVDTTDLIEVYTAHRDSLDEAAGLAHGVYKATGIQPAVHTALLATVLSSNGSPVDSITSWVEGLSTGASLEATDPRLLLRNRWSVDKSRLNSGGRDARADAAYYLVRAWNAYVTGEAIARLQLPRGSKVTAENMPEVAR